MHRADGPTSKFNWGGSEVNFKNRVSGTGKKGW